MNALVIGNTAQLATATVTLNAIVAGVLAGLGALVLTWLGRGQRAPVPVPVRVKNDRRRGDRR